MTLCKEAIQMTVNQAEAKQLVINELKSSDTGIPPSDLIQTLEKKGVNHPLSVIKSVIDDGLARLDPGKNGRPDRYKATKIVWA
jgi:hypothetical protein